MKAAIETGSHADGIARRVRPPSFVHDLNTCVGCHACAIACVMENRLEPGRFWREIVTHNPARAPHVPTFHLSLACNHCLDAPCLDACPALAIGRDDRTGAVVIDGARCVGCRYCSWVCPYDAPRFDHDRGVMEKCTLCRHRLADGLAPACVSLCPTGALRLSDYDEAGFTAVPGFPQADIRPSIRFVPLANRVLLPSTSTGEARVPASDTIVAPWEQCRGTPKITARHEWTLVTFTLVVIVLVAWWIAAFVRGASVDASAFVSLAVGGMGLSTLHLGRKGRAGRAVLNWRRSWVSREVLSYAGFVVLAVLSMVAGAPRLLAIAAGATCVWCIDRVYAVMALQRRAATDAAAATTATAYLAGVMSNVPWLAVPGGLARALGAAWRVRTVPRDRRRRALWLTGFRLVVGILVPLVLWVRGGDAMGGPIVACAITGEAMDRWAFYDDALDVITPRGTMARHV